MRGGFSCLTESHGNTLSSLEEITCRLYLGSQMRLPIQEHLQVEQWD